MQTFAPPSLIFLTSITEARGSSPATCTFKIPIQSFFLYYFFLLFFFELMSCTFLFLRYLCEINDGSFQNIMDTIYTRAIKLNNYFWRKLLKPRANKEMKLFFVLANASEPPSPHAQKLRYLHRQMTISNGRS